VKVSLGKGVYAEFDAANLHLVLTKKKRFKVTDQIVIETEGLMRLTQLMAEKRRAFQAGKS